MTAKDFLDQLEKDPVSRARTAEKEREWAKQAEMFRQDEQPVVEALTAVGWPTHVAGSYLAIMSIADFHRFAQIPAKKPVRNFPNFLSENGRALR